GGPQPARIGQPRQVLDLDGNSALHDGLGNRVLGDRPVGRDGRTNDEKRNESEPHPCPHERLHCHRWEGTLSEGLEWNAYRDWFFALLPRSYKTASRRSTTSVRYCRPSRLRR